MKRKTEILFFTIFNVIFMSIAFTSCMQNQTKSDHPTKSDEQEQSLPNETEEDIPFPTPPRNIYPMPGTSHKMQDGEEQNDNSPAPHEKPPAFPHRRKRRKPVFPPPPSDQPSKKTDD